MKSLATGNSPFSTFVQTLPRLPSVVKHMPPTWHLESLSQVDAVFLEQHGIHAIIWDVDGTLTGDRRTKLHPSAEPAFRALLAMPRLKHVILSNAGEERFVELGGMFPEMPILRAYKQGNETLYRRRLGAFDSWTPQEVARRLEEGAGVIRKPSAELVAYALKELGVERGEVVMIGRFFV